MKNKRAILIAIPLLSIAAVGGTTAVMAADEPAVINGCVASDGVLRVAAACKKNETPISWNKTGPQGLPGAPGPQGETGPQGEVGPAGTAASITRAFGLTVDADITPGHSEGLTSACPAGTVAVGRSLNYLQSIPFEATVLGDMASPTGGWGVQIFNGPTATADIHVRLTAVCI